MLTRDEARAHAREREEARALALMEASRPAVEEARVRGAIIFTPEPDEDYEYTGVYQARDRTTGMWLYGPHFEGTYRTSDNLGWEVRNPTQHESPTFLIYGRFAPAWHQGRGGVGVWIRRIHQESYLPYSDCLYPDDFPIDRVAGLFNAVHVATNPPYRPLIVIDERNVYRDRNSELAALEHRDEIRMLNEIAPDEAVPNRGPGAPIVSNPAKLPGARVWLSRPAQRLEYDDSAKLLTSPSTGLSCRFTTTGTAQDANLSYKATLTRAGETLGQICYLPFNRCWHPDVGPTFMSVLTKQLDREAMPANPSNWLQLKHIAPFFAHPIGAAPRIPIIHQVVVDCRAV